MLFLKTHTLNNSFIKRNFQLKDIIYISLLLVIIYQLNYLHDIDNQVFGTYHLNYEILNTIKSIKK
jgi:hypothetical protein